MAGKTAVKAGVCDCKHHMWKPRIMGLVVLLLGLGLWLERMGNPIGKWWPVLLVLIGLVKIVMPMCCCCDDSMKEKW